VIFDSVVDKRFAVAQLLDECDYLTSSVSAADDGTAAALTEDVRDVSGTFDRIKAGVRRKLVDLKQTFQNNVVEVSVARSSCIEMHHFHPLFIAFRVSSITTGTRVCARIRACACLPVVCERHLTSLVPEENLVSLSSGLRRGFSLG